MDRKNNHNYSEENCILGYSLQDTGSLVLEACFFLDQ
jgi:hypothetical protein